jgi:transposase
MAKELVSDKLWEIVEPLLPHEPPKPEGGRPRIEDRSALSGILFVLKSGIPWEMLPQEMAAEAESPALATLTRVARGWSMGEAASSPLGSSWRGKANRLGARLFRLGECPR